MKHYAGPLLFFLLAYLLPLGWRPMVAPDEHRYALVPRGMIESGDWVAPRLASLVYSEKPVLGYQMTAVSFKIFGENQFALRFPVALSAGLCALLLTLFLRRFTGEDKLAALGALLFLAGGMVYGVGTFAVLDMQLTMFVTGTMVCFLPACLEPKFNRQKVVLLLLAGVFAGLAFLTKGFIAFAVPAVTIVPFLIWEKRWKDFLILPWLPLAAALLVAAPWALLVHRVDPDFWRYFVVEEHLNRFFGGADADHIEPFWALIPALVIGALPAGLLAPYAMVGFLGKKDELMKKSYIRYTLCYALFPFLFFSASSGKLPTYVLPCMAPLAVLGAVGLAAYFRKGGEHRTFRWLTAALGMLLMVVAVLGCVGRVLLPRCWDALNAAPWLPDPVPTGLAALAVFIWGGMLWAGRRQPWRFPLAAFFAGMVPVIIFGQLVIPERALGDKAPNAALTELGRHIPPGAILAMHRSMFHAAAWVYNRSDILLVGSPGELDYGLMRGDGRVRFMKPAEYQAFLLRPDRPELVFLTRERSDDYLPEAAPEHREFRLDGVRLLVFGAARSGRVSLPSDATSGLAGAAARHAGPGE